MFDGKADLMKAVRSADLDQLRSVQLVAFMISTFDLMFPFIR